ncbi:MAG TPA: 2-C-methyl-D-erythritol 4-phosphate cytidylyltransferase [Candidatus Acidoferrales bacterium]|nr:2-C-methyl-D-erythritol 4-phosphate cytidylyltransferase [Candidatus Acidoferrales bacterium]
MSIVAILPAAGMGTRMGADSPKQFRLLDGVPVVVFTLRRLAASPLISSFLISTRADEIEALNQKINAEHLSRPVRVLAGGDTRQESVAKALAEVPGGAEWILVHDAVRPLVTREQVERVINEARHCRAAILGIPAMDTVKEVKRTSLPEDVALITATIPRERVVLAQTPQVFEAALLREAFARAAEDGFIASDEASLVERLGYDVHVVLGSERNLKITRPGDLDIAEFYLSRERMTAEVGR